MKKFLILFALFTIGMVGKIYAQQHKYVPPFKYPIDSLKQRLLYAKTDTNKVKLLDSLGVYYAFARTDSALIYLNQALPLSQKLKFKAGELETFQVLGITFTMRGEYPEALSVDIKALRLAENAGDKNLWYSCIEQIGFLNEISGNHQKASDYLNLVQNHITELKRPDPVTEASYTWTATAFFNMNKLDSARYFMQKAYLLDSKIKYHWYPLYRLMADMQEKKGEYQKAFNYIYPFSNSPGPDIEKFFSYGDLAVLYYKIGKPDSAIYFAREAIKNQKKFGMLLPVLKANQALMEVYTSRHQTDSAYKYRTMVLSIKERMYGQEKALAIDAIAFAELKRRQELTTAEQKYKSRIRIYILAGALVVFLVVGLILWRNNKKQKHTNQLLSEQKEEIEAQRDDLEQAYKELKDTQAQLVQREKMASLGELTAGIAHEIQNPLNFVNNFSDVNQEILEELKAESAKPKSERDEQLKSELIDDLLENNRKINHHGKRADFIVKGMLQHSRTSTGEKQLTNINVLADEFFKLSFHGLRAKDKSFNAEMVTHFDPHLPKINVVQQDMGRVLLNLFNNAFYAVNQKSKTAGADYKPTVVLTTLRANSHIEIRVKDNGNGIPENIKEKVMQPFFTTKPTGEGTGLGLSLSYDIVVKGHGGKINIESKEGEGSEFIIDLSLV